MKSASLLGGRGGAEGGEFCQVRSVSAPVQSGPPRLSALAVSSVARLAVAGGASARLALGVRIALGLRFYLPLSAARI